MVYHSAEPVSVVSKRDAGRIFQATIMYINSLKELNDMHRVIQRYIKCQWVGRLCVCVGREGEGDKGGGGLGVGGDFAYTKIYLYPLPYIH